MTDEQRRRQVEKVRLYLEWVARLGSLPVLRRLRVILSRYPRGVDLRSIRLWSGLAGVQCDNLLERWERHGWVEREYGVKEKADYLARRALGQRVVRVEVEYVRWCWKDEAATKMAAGVA